MSAPVVELGIERLLASGRLRGRRVGIVANPASVDGRLTPTPDRLRADPDVRLGAIFGPQHGFRADVQDNMIETPHDEDRRRRIPVYSLYSETREPTREMLEGLDVLVVDLQDVGTRVYTFIYTMANCLRACAAHRLPVIVCDRPNPIGGAAVEGPVLEDAFRSFVGQFGIPLRHGLTIGELARLFNDVFGIGAALEVEPMNGWRREQYFDETRLPWVMPSPNIPTLDSAVVYPGTVLLEGTNVSEGRGTTRPFELVGAPWLDPDAFADGLNAAGLPGVRFRPVVFQPMFQKHAGQPCGGCQIHVLDRTAFRPVETGVAILQAARTPGASGFGWRQPPYEYEREKLPIDILAGTDRLRRQIETGVSRTEIVAEWRAGLDRFEPRRREVLLY